MGEEEGSSATTSLMSCCWRSVDSLVAGSLERESGSVRENDCALTVLENLEQYWFWDNIFNFGTGAAVSGSSSVTDSMIVGSCPNNLEALPNPFRSIEMVTHKAAEMRETVDLGHQHVELPKPYLQRTWSAFERGEKESRGQEKLRQRHRRSLSVMTVELDSSLHLSTDSKICEHGVHDPDDAGKESPSSTEASQQCPNVPRLTKVETIPSDEQLQERKPEVGIQQTTVRRRERQRATRSMTDLEFDEVKGFMDLGFKFNMDDLNPHVVSMLPGLQRLVGQEKTQRYAQPPRRPYLSEAWLIRRPDSPLLNWRMPSLDEKGVDMKEHLKFWARAVASTVQQES